MIDNAFKARLEDLIRRANERGVVAATGFLDLAAQGEAIALCRAKGCQYALIGGYAGAERCILVCLPREGGEEALAAEKYVACVCFSWKGPDLRHGDVLGAVLSAGLQRACVGDIVFEPEGKEAHAFVYVTAQTAPLIAAIDRIGRLPVVGRIVDLAEGGSGRESGERVTVNVVSLRLDAVLGAALHLARGKAAALIEAGDVSVNWKQTLDKGKALGEGDTISVRRFGRIQLAEIGGRSKKDRVFLTLEVWGR